MQNFAVLHASSTLAQPLTTPPLGSFVSRNTLSV